MTPDKGVREAIMAARAAGVPLVIAAKNREPAEQTYFAEEIMPLLSDQVDVTGEVGGDAKLALLGGARALLNPIQWAEPFGLVMIEAMACGTPVIACPNGAAPEIVDTGSTGYLCSDPADLVAAIHRVDPAKLSGYFTTGVTGGGAIGAGTGAGATVVQLEN